MSNTVIVSIHGILTRSKDEDKWQETFDSWLTRNNKNVIHLPHTYGWLGPINSWLARLFDWFSDSFKLPRWTRRTRIENFKKFLIMVLQEYNSVANVHIMAHSFGTFIVTEALKELTVEYPEFFICSVNLVAGIVSSNIEKNGYINLLGNSQVRFHANKVGTLHSWSSHSDNVVRFIALPPFGHLGYWGLIRPGALEDRSRPLRKPYKNLRAFNNHENAFTHSKYFSYENIFYPAFLKNIKEAETWEKNRKKRERDRRVNLYRKFVERGQSNPKRKSSQTRKKT